MGIFDSAKDKAAELNEQHGDKIEEHSDAGLDKAGEFAEGKGLGADKVEQGRDFADDKIGGGDQGGEGDQQG